MVVIGPIQEVWGALPGHIHKEHELSDVEGRYPADHYVLVDDKIRILTAIKRVWGKRVTTMFPRQATMRSIKNLSARTLPLTRPLIASGNW